MLTMQCPMLGDHKIVLLHSISTSFTAILVFYLDVRLKIRVAIHATMGTLILLLGHKFVPFLHFLFVSSSPLY